MFEVSGTNSAEPIPDTAVLAALSDASKLALRARLQAAQPPPAPHAAQEAQGRLWLQADARRPVPRQHCLCAHRWAVDGQAARSDADRSDGAGPRRDPAAPRVRQSDATAPAPVRHRRRRREPPDARCWPRRVAHRHPRPAPDPMATTLLHPRPPASSAWRPPVDDLAGPLPANPKRFSPLARIGASLIKAW